MELLFFYIFAGVAVASAVMVVTNKNILHAVLFLILTFFVSPPSMSSCGRNSWQ